MRAYAVAIRYRAVRGVIGVGRSVPSGGCNFAEVAATGTGATLDMIAVRVRGNVGPRQLNKVPPAEATFEPWVLGLLQPIQR